MAGLEDLVDETRFFPLLQELATCLCTTLAEFGGPTLCYCGLMVGDQVPIGLMDCTKNCGVAWVRPVMTFPSISFPVPGENAQCGAPLAMTVEIAVARCYPRAQGREARPSEQAMFDAARLYMSDMAAMRKAIRCCFGQRTDGIRHVMGQWTPIPAGAGISGGSWSVTVG